MDLRNWETFAQTGAAVVGATVEVRDATLTHPNPNVILASTVTDANGMYEFLGLSNGPKDIKITYLGKVKWIKGMARHSIDLAMGTNFTPADENLLKNGGLDSWRLTSFNAAAIDTPVMPGWFAKIGAGDVGVVSQEPTILAAGSRYSGKFVYTKAAGPAYIWQALPLSLVSALQGRQITLSAQVRQGVAASTRAFIQDTVETDGATSAIVGTFATLTATRTIAATAGFIYAGIRLDLSDTVYLDNVMLVIGSVPGVFTPHNAGNEVDQVDYSMLDRLYARAFLLGAN